MRFIYINVFFIGVLFFSSSTPLFSQKQLEFHTESIEYLLKWMNNGCKNQVQDSFYKYPSIVFMEQLLKLEENNIPSFKKTLTEFSCSKEDKNDIYLLHKAYKNRVETNNLLQGIKNSSFSKEVYERVYTYFPYLDDNAANYNIYFSATGWQYGDAMTFNYNFENDQYKLSNNGSSAIIFNLTLIASSYGETLDKQIRTFKNVMSHELFHAVLSDYNQNTLHWDNSTIENNTLYFIFNEGIAHYISDKQNLIENYNVDPKLKLKEKNAFLMLRDSLSIAFDKSAEKTNKISAVKSGLSGKYWDKYICISGMFIAYHIEQEYGEEELMKCVQNGPKYFIEKYRSLTMADEEISIPDSIVIHLNEM